MLSVYPLSKSNALYARALHMCNGRQVCRGFWNLGLLASTVLAVGMNAVSDLCLVRLTAALFIMQAWTF